jgi:hypothetical protein
MLGNMEWPADFPKGCPPLDSTDPNGVVYRIVSKRPPNAEDFRSTYDKSPVKNVKNCKARGLSVLRDRTEAERLLLTVPEMGQHVASARLEPYHGKIKSTPSIRSKSHCTWWVRVGTEPEKLFAVEA